MNCRLVLIEWEDSTRPVPEWSWLANHTWEAVVKCRSVGWLVHDGADVKALAPNLGDEGDDMQVCGVIRIPARCITSIYDLNPSGAPLSRPARGRSRPAA